VDTLKDAQVGAQRVQAIVRDLKAFSRATDEPNTAVSLGPVIDYAVRMAGVEIRHRAELVVDVGDVPTVLGSETRLGQVFLNLLVNAAQAIPEGADAANTISVRAAREGDFVVVSVTDTGEGIDPATLSRIFEPFLSTKSHGTGLGLAICHGIVTKLGGSINVTSAVGHGSTFRVSLPIAEPAAASTKVEPDAAPTPAPVRRPRLLLIDDEAILRSVMVRILEPDFEVVPVAGGAEALAELEKGEVYDGVLCDLIMPRMSGMTFFGLLATRLPELSRRVVFLTGGVFTQEATSFLEASAQPVVEKPFTVAGLHSALRRVLPRPSAV
jgi:CheY-like chemotaxis protein/two-component sensor histidine kinase